MRLNINTDAAIKHTVRLEKMHRSALPNAIRNALNSAAFDVKQNTMPATASDEFVNRQPNFFKANSKVEMAKGWDLNGMKSTVGFVENGLKGGNNYAVKDLEDQEKGGVIEKKSFIPLKTARTGNSNEKLVRPNARLSKIKKIVNARSIPAKNNRERFTKAAIEAGKGGFVLSGKILWKINSLKQSKGKMVINKTPLYSYLKNRSVKVGQTGFMKTASLQSAKKIEMFYIRSAEREIRKLK